MHLNGEAGGHAVGTAISLVKLANRVGGAVAGILSVTVSMYENIKRLREGTHLPDAGCVTDIPGRLARGVDRAAVRGGPAVGMSISSSADKGQIESSNSKCIHVDGSA